MKTVKQILILFFFFILSVAHAQDPIKDTSQLYLKLMELREKSAAKVQNYESIKPGLVKINQGQNVFYNTYEDYLANKPIENLRYFGYSVGMTSSIMYFDNDKLKNKNVKKIPYFGFCDNIKILNRFYDGKFYIVLVDGDISLYVLQCVSLNIYPSKYKTSYLATYSDSFGNSNAVRITCYYSLTPTGAIEKFDKKVFEEYLRKYGLFEEFENDEEFEANRFIDPIGINMMHKRIKWIQIINQKIKEEKGK